MIRRVSIALLLLAACSSDEDPDPIAVTPDASVADAGSTPQSEASAPVDAGSDTHRPAPPPYDFAVKCAGNPCVTQIAARGGGHACAVLQDGNVRCWGSNESGQLGTGRRGDDAGSFSAYEPTPQPVVGGEGRVVRLAGDGERPRDRVVAHVDGHHLARVVDMLGVV